MQNFNKNIQFNNDNSSSKKKMVLVGIIACIVLILVLFLLIIFYTQIDATTFKLYINDTRVSFSDDFYIYDDSGNVYIKARDLASYIGWSYENGEYGSFTEDTSSGYIQNEYEVASFVADSTVLKKYIEVIETTITEDDEDSDTSNEEETLEIDVYSENDTLETIELNLPIISYNDQIYFPLESISDICNCSYSYEEYRIYIYDLNYLIDLALETAANYGYSNISGIYENLRTLPYGMIVTIDTSGKFGVIPFDSSTAIIGFKYSEMIFQQSRKEFFVKSTDNTVGIISYNGNVIISPKNYDSISILSDTLGLYLIEQDFQYGVMDRNGNTIIHTEFDSIGLSDEAAYIFVDEIDDNRYVLFGNTIVVELDNKYGFYNLEGENILQVNFQGIGYINETDELAYEKYLNSGDSSSSSRSNTTSDSDEDTSSTTATSQGNSVLTIDLEIEIDGEIGKVQGIVVEQIGLDGEYAYGVFDAIQGRLIIPCACSRIYSITRSGNTTYYLEYNGQQLDFEDYIIQNNLYTLEATSDEAETE